MNWWLPEERVGGTDRLGVGDRHVHTAVFLNGN